MRLTWRDKAACIEADPEPFFGTDEQQTDAAAVCDRCPVQPDCLEHALITNQQHGVWGGLTERQRIALRRRHRRPLSSRQQGGDPR